AYCPTSNPALPTVCNGVSWKLLQVAGTDGPFCARGPNYCSTAITDSCPGPQPGLPYGSFCYHVQATDVFMCVPHTKCPDGATLPGLPSWSYIPDGCYSHGVFISPPFWDLVPTPACSHPPVPTPASTSPWSP
ncbi:hypothetical protein As57867_007132, partial [Aphanomyces stellatus]